MSGSSPSVLLFTPLESTVLDFAQDAQPAQISSHLPVGFSHHSSIYCPHSQFLGMWRQLTFPPFLHGVLSWLLSRTPTSEGKLISDIILAGSFLWSPYPGRVSFTFPIIQHVISIWPKSELFFLALDTFAFAFLIPPVAISIQQIFFFLQKQTDK